MSGIAGIPDWALAQLLAHYRARIEKERPILEQVLMLGGALNVWTHYFLSDETVRWEEKILAIDGLHLTGIDPYWNDIILVQCGRSPKRLRDHLLRHPDVAREARQRPNDGPVFIRSERPRMVGIRLPVSVQSVLEGMNTVVRAIAEGQNELRCIVGHVPVSRPKPACEEHVVYDLIVAYRRKHADRGQVVAALTALLAIFPNVRTLLTTRFGPDWEPEAQDLIREVLK